MEHVKRYGELGWTDWCAVEIKDALADPRTEVIPLFHPDYAMDDFAGQLNVIPGLSAQNAKSIGGPGHFEKSILTVHELIQRDIVKKRRQAAQLQHESELVATLSSASRKLQAQVDLPEGVPHWSRSRSQSKSRCRLVRPLLVRSGTSSSRTTRKKVMRSSRHCWPHSSRLAFEFSIPSETSQEPSQRLTRCEATPCHRR